MADDILKTQLEIDLTEESKSKLTKDVSDAISEGVDNKENKDIIKNAFDFKNVKKGMIKNLSDAFGVTGKMQDKQNKLAEKFKDQQANITKLIGTQGKGFKGNAQLVGLIGKQGMTAMAGIASKINPIMAAIVVAAEAIKFITNQLQRIAKDSAKFVGQGSIFGDKATMGMMQQTGQTATQAQATQRSLGSLGLEFSDIQQGKITQEQAALFEQLRNRELAKIEQINAVAGPMFESLQQVTLGLTLLGQDINDWITEAFAQAPGIEKLIGSVKGFITNLAPLAKSFISKVITPIASILGDVIGLIMDFVTGLMPGITLFIDMISPLFMFIMEVVGIISKVLGPIISFATTLYGIFKAISKFISPLGILMVVIKALLPIFEFLGDVIGKFAELVGSIIEGIVGVINSVIGALRDFKIAGWQPFKDFKELDVQGISSTVTNSGGNYENQTTNNYIYGSQSMQQSQSSNANDLFTNSYVLVND